MKFQINRLIIIFVVMTVLFTFGNEVSAQQARLRIKSSINEQALNPQPLPPKEARPSPPSPCLTCGSSSAGKPGSDRTKGAGNKSVARSRMRPLKQ